MKITRSPLRRSAGVALVLVLTFLVLISALIVAFFSNVSTELNASKSFSAGVSTRQLSETATNFVMGQLSEATSGFADPKNLDSPVLAWASQPGMIRTYQDDGSAYRFYKLYSAQSMVISKPTDSFNVNREFESDLPKDWYEKPGVFTDLNAPIKGQDSIYSYPIVDPTVQRSSSTGVSDGVDGFEIMSGPGFSGTQTRVAVTDNTLGAPNANPAMMPARWLYVLQDGTLTPAPDALDGIVSWGSAGGSAGIPTKDNPIVGRIAFWTDDETAKINVNTASEGTFWDRPWSRSAPLDANFGNYIPAQGEYQRYAGHPAMTCLSPVLGSILPVRVGPANSPPTTQERDDKKAYYWLVPRTMDGGTKAGTDLSYAQGVGGMGSDYERLFASVDEVAFSPLLTGGSVGNFARTIPGTNVMPPAKAAGLAELIRRSKFFLTVSNRAPDVNLFNRPRISLWPLQVDTTNERNVKDNLIAFCGSTSYKLSNESRYYFQRLSSYSLKKQLNGDGRTRFLSSLQSQPVPSSCHPTLDWTDVRRNRELYAYLQEFTSRDIPGFGGNLKDKWDAGLPPGISDRDQILTQSMDFVRSQVNTYGTSNTLTPFYDYAPTRNGGPVAGETQIIPLRIPASPPEESNSTQGFGRYATVTEIAVAFQRVETTLPGGAKENRLRAFLILEPYNPSPGPASWSPHLRYVVKGLEKFLVGGSAFSGEVKIGFPEPSSPDPAAGVYPSNWTTARVGYAGGGHKLAWMGLSSMFRYFQGNPDPPKQFGTRGREIDYPFATEKGALIADPTKPFDITKPVPLEIEIYSGYERIDAGANLPVRNPSAALLVQRIKLEFPAVSGLPMPAVDNVTINERLTNNGAIRANDVVRSVEILSSAAGGDLRHVCALPVVSKQYFGAAPRYATSDRQVHTLRSNGFNNAGYDPAAAADPVLVPGASYPALTINNHTTRRWIGAANYLGSAQNISGTGDFDNAPSDWPDGAYINKADEGNISTRDSTSGENRSWFSTGDFAVEDGRTFSPNRQISSAVAFGSLPTGIKATDVAMRTGQSLLSRPWQTLLFTPHPASRSSVVINFSLPAGAGRHPGFGVALKGTKNAPPYVVPPDHLFLDLFTMPVIEPYAISEPFSTQGRVNLNYQIAPYTYIKRTTGLRAVLKSTKITAIPTTSADKTGIRRYEIDPSVGGSLDGAKLDPTDGTLHGFQQKFNAGDVFRSASQICDISLIPSGGANYASIDSFWYPSTNPSGGHRRTGDNLREGPYGHIYPRVTTKSNTFTVHMRVQALRKSASSPANEWKEGTDQIVGEYRGSSTLERYIDAADPSLPDFANPKVKDNLDRHYRFRILNSKAFVR